MVKDQIKTLLEAEMKASDEFSQRNFGLSTGDDFRELVEEVTQSNRVAAELMMGVLMVGLTGPRLSEFAKDHSLDPAGAGSFTRRTVLANLDTFKAPLEFLYWGMQVGRKLAIEEMESLKKMESCEPGSGNRDE